MLTSFLSSAAPPPPKELPAPKGESPEVLHNALMRLVVDFEREVTRRKAAEAKVVDLEKSMSTKKRVRFVDGPSSSQLVERRQEPPSPIKMVPASLVLSAESHSRGLQCKINAYYEELSTLESKLDRETSARLDAERKLADVGTNDRNDDDNETFFSEGGECPSCYGALVDGKRLPCCGAVSCLNCLKDMMDDGALCCSECFTRHVLDDPSSLPSIAAAAPAPPDKTDNSTQTMTMAPDDINSATMSKALATAEKEEEMLVSRSIVSTASSTASPGTGVLLAIVAVAVCQALFWVAVQSTRGLV